MRHNARLLTLILATSPLQASVLLPPAYVEIAAVYHMPPELLYSVALTESRHPELGKPWPWTMNCEGQSFYFEDLRQAIISAAFSISAGKSCDIGLMQVNWYWNGHRFNNLADAFDPLNNLRVGASVLFENYRRLGTWGSAVGAYHSPGNVSRAFKYRMSVTKNLVQVLREGGVK